MTDLVKITATVEGLTLFNRTLSRFVDETTDFRQLAPGIVVELRSILREQFAGEGVGPNGNWPALSKRYAAEKEKLFPGKPILQRTGALIESLTGNTAHTINVATQDSLTFGTSLFYASYHQRPRRAGRPPKRAIFDFTEAHKRRITKAIQRRALHAGRNSGITLK